MMPLADRPHKFYLEFSVPSECLGDFVESVSRFGRFIDWERYAKGSRNARSSFVKRSRRLDMVLRCLKPGSEVVIGQFYRFAKRRGYVCGYKTFQRDVAELGLLGKVEARVVRGGAQGNTTFVRLRELGE